MNKVTVVFAFLLCLVMAIPAQAKEWTVLVYIAGDNDLGEFGLIDINEMEKVGSTEEVNIIVQFDGSEEYTPENAGAKRYFIKKDDDDEKITSPILEDLGEVDMGSKKTFRDFVEWASMNYPADKTAIVLWNHGNGWYQDVESSSIDITVPQDVEQLVQAVEAAQKGDINNVLKDVMAKRRVIPTSMSPFKKQVAETEVELFDDNDGAICYDEGNGTTAMSTTDVEEVLRKVSVTHGTNFELIGFDACLMAMVEVMYELRKCGKYCVASQIVEPGDGWAYDDFLACLKAQPEMNGEKLGKEIVRSFTDSYRENNEYTFDPFALNSTTLCCVDLSQMEKLGNAINNLGFSLAEKGQGARELALATTVNTQHCGVIAQTEPTVLLAMTAHRDLIRFARNIKKFYEQDFIVPQLANKVIKYAERAIVSFEKLDESPLTSVKNARGLSIYVPCLAVDETYGELEMGKGSWRKFLNYLEATPAERKEIIDLMTGKASVTKVDNFNRLHGE